MKLKKDLPGRAEWIKENLRSKTEVSRVDDGVKTTVRPVLESTSAVVSECESCVLVSFHDV